VIDKKELYNIADFILNKADEKDLMVVEEALKRRRAQKGKKIGGVDISHLAHTTGEAMARQLTVSHEQIRETVTELVRDMIKQRAPEIRDDELQVLLNEWVPDPKTRKKRLTEKEKNLPEDVILKMIDQFLRFSNGQMSMDEQKELRDTMPEWQQEYWNGFPQKIRALITLYLKGKIDSETCWHEIKKELFGEEYESKKGNQQKNNS